MLSDTGKEHKIASSFIDTIVQAGYTLSFHVTVLLCVSIIKWWGLLGEGKAWSSFI